MNPDPPENDWQLWRQDDSGHRYLMFSSPSEAEAERLRAEYERRGHKQLYWVQRTANIQSRVEIHPVRDDEIPLLEQHLGFDVAASGKHRDRLARQKEGSVVYLVAWLDGLPVGHALLKWRGAVNPVLSSIPHCPDVEDLFVSPSLRSRGIGSRLLGAAESLARQRGDARIGLAVSVDNPRARALYERRGYRDAGIGTFDERWSTVDAAGQTHWWQETCTYLIKALDET